MKIELVIDATPEEVKIAMLRDGDLVELHSEKGKKDFVVGDLYLGKVRKVIPTLNAAFVHVGYEKDAFLHYLDLGPQFSSLKNYTKRVMDGKQNSPELSDFKLSPDIDKGGKIKDQVSSSQQIVVQIAKEPISSKGPRLSTEITLAGRYLVLVPFSNKISLSQRIKSDKERDRLKRLLKSIKPANFGIIVRTVAENKKVAELDSDLRELIERWNTLYGNLKTAAPPKRILGELKKTNTLLRDLLDAQFTDIHVNDANLAQEIKTYIRSIAPEKESIVQHYSKTNVNIFEHHGIHKQIKSSFGKQVNLPSGAYLIIEHTEAMHVIDVNSGNRKSAEKNQEANAVSTNLECAKEIARLLKLRDMGGIIAIDFIDMQDRNNQKMLHEKLKEYMQDDKARCNILPPSRFGVVEITRQRVRPETDIKTAQVCPSCNGNGEVQPPLLMPDEIENHISYITKEGRAKKLELYVHPVFAAYLTKGIFSSIKKSWVKKYGIKINVLEDSSMNFLEYKFLDENNVQIEL